jgi:tRNA threonylcarbamoyladenosine biosynthesis protein TsaB
MILMIETSSAIGSVALFGEDRVMVSKKTTVENAHAEQIPEMVNSCMQLVGFKFSDLKAVAVNKGPGSYTGLRIGTSLAKGICYATGVPLIAADSLKVMAQKAKAAGMQADIYISMFDARRDEVFTATYNQDLQQTVPLHAEILGESSFNQFAELLVVVCGNCAEKTKRIAGKPDYVDFFDGLPSAEDYLAETMSLFQERKFENTAYFEPQYGKEFMAGTSTKFAL